MVRMYEGTSIEVVPVYVFTTDRRISSIACPSERDVTTLLAVHCVLLALIRHLRCL